ncbi:hypothetical protein OS493_010377 [Desmophyllum pertusum]|uniref:Uncharacterized protein n=1 Tax=Desmophyllum pertusum TaxID=174260 RepID=A0A9X0A701_9CNID|nr:hypothetical protein OS493_010377 [Desmophyllum pertusum]
MAKASSLADNLGKELECAVCLEPIPQGKVDSLPVNFFLNNLLSMVSLHGDSGDSNLECDNCESETKTKAIRTQRGMDGVSEMKRNVQSHAEQTVQEVITCFQELTTHLNNTRCEELIHDIEEFKKSKLEVVGNPAGGIGNSARKCGKQCRIHRKGFEKWQRSLRF